MATTKSSNKKQSNKKSTKDLLSLSGRMRVYRGMYGFSTSFGKKNEDDEFINAYMNVNFKKNQEPDCNKKESVEIDVIHGFISCYETSSGDIKPVIWVTEYDEV